jgi:hypothetical protein
MCSDAQSPEMRREIEIPQSGGVLNYGEANAVVTNMNAKRASPLAAGSD